MDFFQFIFSLIKGSFGGYTCSLEDASPTVSQSPNGLSVRKGWKVLLVKGWPVHGCPAHPAGCQLPTTCVPWLPVFCSLSKKVEIIQHLVCFSPLPWVAFEKESCFSQRCFTQNDVSVIRLILSNSAVSVSGDISESNIEWLLSHLTAFRDGNQKVARPKTKQHKSKNPNTAQPLAFSEIRSFSILFAFRPCVLNERVKERNNFGAVVKAWDYRMLPFIPVKHCILNRLVHEWDWWSVVGFGKLLGETFILWDVTECPLENWGCAQVSLRDSG